LVSLALYWVGVFGTLPMMDNAIRRKLRERKEPMSPWTWNKALLMFIAVPLTQLVYTSALFWLHFMKRVEWRGVWYEIGKKNGKDKTVKLIEYVPYSDVERSKTEEPTSL
jgi:hypothetical protein